MSAGQSRIGFLFSLHLEVTTDADVLAGVLSTTTGMRVCISKPRTRLRIFLERDQALSQPHGRDDGDDMDLSRNGRRLFRLGNGG